MSNQHYLLQILEDQTLADDSKEIRELQNHRAYIENLLRTSFENASPTIRYGGSKAKGTMIKEAYDLDVICYFPHDNNIAGETLREIYDNTRKALEKQYYVDPKSSALRLKGKAEGFFKVDFHVDVVPGRYIDNSKSDVFLFQHTSPDKERLKTNPDIHINYVKNSGVREAIRLVKLWRARNGLQIKHFALELLVIKMLKNKTADDLSSQLAYVWSEFRDNADALTVQDPANPSGNDLSELLNATVRRELMSVATNTLDIIATSGWKAVFGKPDNSDNAGKTTVLHQAARAVTVPTKPWTPSS